MKENKKIKKLEKELEDERLSLGILAIFSTLLIGLLMYVIFIFSEEDKIDKINDEWKCPLLLENGNYKFDNGVLTSPSGEQFICEKVESKQVECYVIETVTTNYWDVKNNLITGQNTYIKNMTKENCELIRR